MTRRALQGEVITFSEEFRAGLIRSDDGRWFILRLQDFGFGNLFPLRGEIVVFEVEEDLQYPPSFNPATPHASNGLSGTHASPRPIGRAVRAKRLVDIVEAEADAAAETEAAMAARQRRAERSRKTASARWERIRAKQGQLAEGQSA